MWVILRINCLCTSLLQDSWKTKLQNKFKNLHRPERARTAGIVLEEGGSSPKKTEIIWFSEVKVTNSDMDEYQRNIKTLKMSYESKKWTLNGLKSLMTETSGIVTVGNF